MENGLEEAKGVPARKETVTKCQVSYNGGLIDAREAGKEKSGYIQEILTRNNLQTGDHLVVRNQERKELSMTVAQVSGGDNNGGTTLLCPVFFYRAFLFFF